MAKTYGESLKLSIFGTSHGSEIGMTLEGIPAGLPVDLSKLQTFLDRRAPGKSPWSTARKEADIPLFQSGLTDGLTNGDTITAVIKNENVRSSDYEELKYIPRPGHADFTAWMKYGLDYDMAGGGPFSGRMTAPLCIAGGLCKQWLEEKGIRVWAHIQSIDMIEAYVPFNLMDYVEHAMDPTFPVFGPLEAEQMKQRIQKAKDNGDSVGGVIQCVINGVPAGVGGPMFDGLESHIAQIVYSIPAVKGVEFGEGFDLTNANGSFINDAYIILDGKVQTESNYCGGILGGISNGMPIYFRVAIKPTPSIAKPQKSVNLKTMEKVTIEIKGRHDPCIVPRAVPVVEAAAAIAIYDLMLGGI